MDEFFVVLPSNVANVGAITNTPACYATTFENAIHLSERESWEVALHEISFVDTIETIHEETFTVTYPTKRLTYKFSGGNVEDIVDDHLKQVDQVLLKDFKLSENNVIEIGYDSKSVMIRKEHGVN